jgi:hypothetical protein
LQLVFRTISLTAAKFKSLTLEATIFANPGLYRPQGWMQEKRATTILKSVQPLHQLNGHILRADEKNQFPIMKGNRLVLDDDPRFF